MTSYKIEYLGVRGDLLEGPHWMGDQQKLLFCSIREGKVHIWDPATKQLETVTMESTVGFVVPHCLGGYVAGVGKKIQHFQWNDHQNPRTIAEIDQGLNNRFNDGKCDPQGRLWGGTCSLSQTRESPLRAGSLYRFDRRGDYKRIRDGYNRANGLAWAPSDQRLYHVESLFPSCVYLYDFCPQSGDASTCSLDQDLETPTHAGNLYRFDHSGKASKFQDGYNIANGLAWAPDGGKFFHADSIFPSAVYVFDVNAASGDIANRRVLVDFSATTECRPDGMTVDTEGKLWLVLHGQSKVVQLDPSTGQTIREVYLPLKNVTSCTFGGQNLDELYVTSMTWDEHDPPEAGSLMRVTGLGARGLPATVYKGQ